MLQVSIPSPLDCRAKGIRNNHPLRLAQEMLQYSSHLGMGMDCVLGEILG
jgi:hypothetical protein